MTFLVAWRLGFLVLVGAFTGAWLAGIFRRKKDVVRFTDVALLDVVAPVRSPWRRHLPAALWLLSLTALIVGFAEPVRDVTVEREAAAVVIAIDVSLSMEADDVEPTRLDAAKAAATDFVEELPEFVDVGLVLFWGDTESYAPVAFEQRPALIDKIENASLDEYTDIGGALDRSLSLIEDAAEAEDEAREDEAGDENDDETEVPPGRVVLMADGDDTIGRTPEEAAADAAAAGVSVDAISFGTPQGTITDPQTGAPVPVEVAPDTLEDIAETTGGQFFDTDSLETLSAAYEDVAAEYTVSETEEERLNGWFLGGGLALLVIAGGLSLLWSQRLP